MFSFGDKWQLGSSCKTCFCVRKTWVAPIKPLIFLKLELQAALLAVRLRDEIKLALKLPVEPLFIWTDRTAVLQWLQSIDNLLVFVAIRKTEILELMTTGDWNYIQISENTADAGTSGLSAHALTETLVERPRLFLDRELAFPTVNGCFEQNQNVENTSDQVLPESGSLGRTAITANFANITSTFE